MLYIYNLTTVSVCAKVSIIVYYINTIYTNLARIYIYELPYIYVSIVAIGRL
jgi:hypothetical protein